MFSHTKPACCPDQKCQCLACTPSSTTYEYGESFDCVGKMPEGSTIKVGDTVHENDLCHCVWTPRGWNRYLCNNTDLTMFIQIFIVATLKNNLNPTYLLSLIDNALRRWPGPVSEVSKELDARFQELRKVAEQWKPGASKFEISMRPWHEFEKLSLDKRLSPEEEQKLLAFIDDPDKNIHSTVKAIVRDYFKKRGIPLPL